MSAPREPPRAPMRRTAFDGDASARMKLRLPAGALGAYSGAPRHGIDGLSAEPSPPAAEAPSAALPAAEPTALADVA